MRVEMEADLTEQSKKSVTGQYLATEMHAISNEGLRTGKQSSKNTEIRTTVRSRNRSWSPSAPRTAAVKEREQTLVISHLYMKHDVHGMEYLCWPAWVRCSGSAPPQCYLAPASGQFPFIPDPKDRKAT